MLITSSQVAVFCMEHLAKCYHSTCDWRQLEAWKMRESEILQQEKHACLRKQMLENVAPQQATCLRKFEEAEEISLKELSDWTLLDEQARTNWSCAKTMIECTNTLTNVAMKIQAVGAYESEESRAKELDGLTEGVLRCRKVAARIVKEGLRNVPSEYLNEALLVQYSAAGLSDLLSGESRNRANIFELSEVIIQLTFVINTLYQHLI